MNVDTVITLGGADFSRYEVPEKITFGGEQALAVHDLVGGARVVDAMGRQDAPIEWSGLFYGENALDRARYLNGQRIAGNPLPLTWSEFSYLVVIKSFICSFERFYKLPYTLSLVVVQDMTNPVVVSPLVGFDETINADIASANALAASIGDGPLSTTLATLNAAITAVSSFATAAQSTINSVLTPLAMVRARVKVLTATVGNTITNVATVGGILPNTPIAKQASRMNTQISAMTQAPQLYNLDSVLGRMQGNLGVITSTGRSATVAGGDMFKMAAKFYGDASSWTTIAKANKTADPVVTGVQTLTIPAVPDSSGGVYTA